MSYIILGLLILIALLLIVGRPIKIEIKNVHETVIPKEVMEFNLKQAQDEIDKEAETNDIMREALNQVNEIIVGGKTYASEKAKHTDH